MFLYGASGHGKVVLEIAEDNNVLISGFIDNNVNLNYLLDYVIYDNLQKVSNEEVLITIGDNFIRRKIALANNELNYGSLVSRKANISSRCIIGIGCVVMAGVTINSCVEIGSHCILNTNCSIDHDSFIGDFVHVSPNVALAGNVNVGDGVHIGIGAVVIQGVQIGKWAVIGAGAVIIEDVPDFAVVVGVPGKVIKFNSSSI